ncbi:MAG: hypothetical protein QOJ70_1113 [Acidobacteriota bacterium]|nr:hypothetical protein [Acidobacteriota bacterium]
MKAATLTVAFMFLLCPVAFAQDGQAFARYDDRGHMVGISNLSVRETRERCERFVYIGKVVRAEYDNKGQLLEFNIRRKNQRTETFNLIDATFDAANVKKLPTLLKKGARVRVVAYGCGASAAVLDADSINLL